MRELTNAEINFVAGADPEEGDTAESCGSCYEFTNGEWVEVECPE
ncbi:MAG: hypothetical protein AAFZ74_19090 [Pseudomonadota bacterium]